MDKLNEGPKAYNVVILSNNYYKLFLCKSIDIIFTFFLTLNFCTTCTRRVETYYSSRQRLLLTEIFQEHNLMIHIILSLGYRSQVWCPYTLLNTIDLCTSPLLLYEVRSKEQVTSD